MRKTNLLHLITGLGMGGAERVVLDLAKHSDKDAFNTFVVSLSQRVEMLEEYQKNKINVTALQKDNSFKSLVQIIIFLNRYVKKNQIDVIHAHMTHSMIIASAVKLLNPHLKIVFTSHSINVESKLREIVLFFLKPFRKVDILFSEEQKSFFYTKTVKYIPNGIDISIYEVEEPKNDLFTFISVGRLGVEKNHTLLLDVAKEIPNKYEFQILLVGDGVLKEELHERCKKYKIEHRIKFLGLRRDIPMLLNKSHCFIMPSLWEGLPIALLEAGAAQLPVIAPPVGSIGSVLDGNNAYLVDHSQFKNTMIEVMENYDEAIIKGLKLKETIKKDFSIQSVVYQHEQIYIDVLKKV